MGIVLTALVYSFIKSPNVDWPTAWKFIFKPPALVGAARTIAPTFAGTAVGAAGGVTLHRPRPLSHHVQALDAPPLLHAAMDRRRYQGCGLGVHLCAAFPRAADLATDGCRGSSWLPNRRQSASRGRQCRGPGVRFRRHTEETRLPFVDAGDESVEARSTEGVQARTVEAGTRPAADGATSPRCSRSRRSRSTPRGCARRPRGPDARDPATRLPARSGGSVATCRPSAARAVGQAPPTPRYSPPRRRAAKTAPSARGAAFYPSSSSDSIRSAFRPSRAFSFFFRSAISFLTLRSSA